MYLHTKNNTSFTDGSKVSQSIGIHMSQLFGFCDLDLDSMSNLYTRTWPSYREDVQAYQKYYHDSFKGGNKVSRNRYRI